MNDQIYDSSWDEGNEDLWDQKYEEWETRDWQNWLSDNLTFPFEVKRKAEWDGDPFSPSKDRPFSLGHVMNVLSIEYDDRICGIIVKVQEGKKKGEIPLYEAEVTSKADPNFWPVREYLVWYANR